MTFPIGKNYKRSHELSSILHPLGYDVFKTISLLVLNFVTYGPLV